MKMTLASGCDEAPRGMHDRSFLIRKKVPPNKISKMRGYGRDQQNLDLQEVLESGSVHFINTVNGRDVSVTITCISQFEKGNFK